MFAPKPATPSAGGLSINTNSANSLFPSASNAQPAAPATSTTNTSGGLFGSLGSTTAQPKPAGGLFGNTGTTQQPQASGSSMFPGAQQQQSTTGGGMFGSSTATSAQPQSTSLFPGAAGAGSNTTQSGTAGGGLFSLGTGSVAQTLAKPFGSIISGNQQQQQQQTTVPGVKVDLSNLLPTTKFESCADEIKADLEKYDTFVANQMKMCNEVSSMLPSIASQGATVPNDVEFVQGKLETMQHALENDASDIDQLRGLVSRDAAEAQVAFRAIDTLKLPLQYQNAGGAGWWSPQDQNVSDRQSLRSTRKNTLALPDDVEADPSTAASVNGIPVNLVDYFSHRSDEMGTVLERYTRNLKDIEDHLHGVEATLNRQIHDFVASRNRDSSTAAATNPALNDLTAVLQDVETGILGVATRLGGVSEQVQEVVLGPPSAGDGRLNL